MKKEEINYLAQLMTSFEEAEAKLEQYYKEKNVTAFNSVKKFVLQIQQKTKEMTG
jgi:hypothetical protein